MLYASTSYDKNMRAAIIQIPLTGITEAIKISVDKEWYQLKNPVIENIFRFLNQAEIEFFLKDQIYDLIQKENRLPILLSRLHTMKLDEKLLAVLLEMLTAK